MRWGRAAAARRKGAYGMAEEKGKGKLPQAGAPIPQPTSDAGAQIPQARAAELAPQPGTATALQAGTAPRPAPSGKIWSKAFISIFIANGALAMGQQMVNVLIALYVDSLGASTTLVGFAVSAFAYTCLVLKIVSGPAIDAFSRKKILIVASFAVAASYVVFSISGNIVVVILARLLQGSAMAFTFTCCLAMATDTLPRERVNTGIGYFSLAQAACMAIGPMVGLTLADAFG